MTNRRRSDGFTLAEILVAVAIIAVLAAAVVPTIFGRLEAARADAIISEMQSLENGMMLFYRDVGRYPGRLDRLNVLTANDADACGAAIVANNSSRFRGPYIDKTLSLFSTATGNKYLMSTGDTVAADVARNLLTTATGNERVLQIFVTGLGSSVMNLIDYKVDGASSASSGKVIFTTAPDTLKWTIPIRMSGC